MIQLEDVLGQLRKEYEMLRIEFEQNLAANEQTGPINREMRHLITSLQNHNQQLKGEVHRYKRKYKDTSQELNKVRTVVLFKTLTLILILEYFPSIIVYSRNETDISLTNTYAQTHDLNPLRGCQKHCYN